MSHTLEQVFAELGQRVVGGQGRTPAEIISDGFSVAAAESSLLQATKRSARCAIQFQQARDYEHAILHWRKFATYCWWLGNHWTLTVPIALAAAAQCALQLGRRSVAGRLLAPARLRFSVADLISGERGLRKLLLFVHRDELDFPGSKTQKRSERTRGRSAPSNNQLQRTRSAKAKRRGPRR